MELVRQNRKRPQVPRFAIHLQLRLYLRLMLGVLLGIMVIVSGALALTRLMPPPTNLFAAYNDILPGHPKQAALEHGFICFPVLIHESESCTQRGEPVSPFVAGVHLSTLGDRLYTLTLYVNTLTVGDLVLLWGRPDIQLRGRIAQVYWPSPNVTAFAVLPFGRPLNYFIPIDIISFTAF